jgi:ribosomal protein L7/L12
MNHETLQTLIGIKLEFYRDEDLRDKFIERLLTHHPEMAVSVFESLTGKSKIAIEHAGSVKYVEKTEHNVVADFAKSARKVEAIRHLRGITGWGLKEAKDYIEFHWP